MPTDEPGELLIVVLDLAVLLLEDASTIGGGAPAAPAAAPASALLLQQLLAFLRAHLLLNERNQQALYVAHRLGVSLVYTSVPGAARLADNNNNNTPAAAGRSSNKRPRRATGSIWARSTMRSPIIRRWASKASSTRLRNFHGSARSRRIPRSSPYGMRRASKPSKTPGASRSPWARRAQAAISQAMCNC